MLERLNQVGLWGMKAAKLKPTLVKKIKSIRLRGYSISLRETVLEAQPFIPPNHGLHILLTCHYSEFFNFQQDRVLLWSGNVTWDLGWGLSSHFTAQRWMNGPLLLYYAKYTKSFWSAFSLFFLNSSESQDIIRLSDPQQDDRYTMTNVLFYKSVVFVYTYMYTYLYAPQSPHWYNI